MTDRFRTLTVLLENETREDDAEHLMNAILMLKGVIKVEGNVVNFSDWGAESLARHKLGKKLLEVLK